MEPQILIENLNDMLLTDSFIFIEILGKGSFGVVVSAFCQTLDKAVAIKITPFADKENEANLLKACCHPNIVKFYKVLVAKNYLYLIMERLVGQTLEMLMKTKILSEETIRNIMKQILNGLLFLHKKNIVHRDLKPENIFICENNCVKLIDLGLGREIVSKGCVNQSVGTPYFIAPEVILGREQTQAIDIFSLGIIFYMMINNWKHPLWDGQMRKRQYYKLISEEFKIEFPQEMNKYPYKLESMAKDFVINTVQFIPEYRMTALQCLEHPWMMGQQIKTYPVTAREIRLRYNIQQNIETYITAIMFLTYLKKVCVEEIRYTKNTQLSLNEINETNELNEPITARQSVQQQKSFRLNAIPFKRVNSYKEITNKKEQILNQKKYQNMITRFREKLNIGYQLVLNGHHNFESPLSHRKLTTLPSIGQLQRQSTFNFQSQ